MGGYGSTRWNAYSKRRTVEECMRFTLADITRTRGRALPELVGTSGSLSWTSGSSISYMVRQLGDDLELFLAFSVNGQSKAQPITLSESECNYGGVRYWMHCPHCYKRAIKLYIVWGRVACRQCHDLTYTSAQEAHRFDSLKRVLGAGLDMLDEHYKVQELIAKWDARKRLTKGERRKIANALDLAVFMVRSRWYRRDAQKRRAHELAARLAKAVLK